MLFRKFQCRKNHYTVVRNGERIVNDLIACCLVFFFDEEGKIIIVKRTAQVSDFIAKRNEPGKRIYCYFPVVDKQK